jgi:protein involved in polysaccharide export with SLBB domain
VRKFYIICFLLINNLFAQVSASDIRELGNQQLDAIKNELQSKAKGAIVSNVDTPSPTAVSISSNAVSLITGDYFGYNYFQKDISFFDNIPTPADYRLGPGDEIILTLWGETNFRLNMNIDKDGMIFYEKIGFINLSNQTLLSAEKILINEFSKIYSTLNDEDESTKLTLSLGRLKSMNIYFSGHVENPGINLIHPFSDIFSALVQAGGINSKGSLREIQLIRNGKIQDTVDFYSFFMDGKNDFSKIKLIDGDVIHVPNIKRRIQISGGVKRSSAYELLKEEKFSDLLKYASGITTDASSNIILTKTYPIKERISDDYAIYTMATNFQEIDSVTLNNGDTVEILKIPSVNTTVLILGQVKRPGNYPANNMSLKNILDIAGGFDDPTFRKTIIEDIVILRKDEENFYSKEIIVPYKDANDFNLAVDDKILVYKNINYDNAYTYEIGGQVNKPGFYHLKDTELTIDEAIKLAGGFTILADPKNIVLKKQRKETNGRGETITFDQVVNNATGDFKIGINSFINVLPYENTVQIKGNVYNPGLLAHYEGKTFKDYIELAGGTKERTHKKKIYIKRANGSIEKASGLFNFSSRKIYAGDTIVIPRKPDNNNFDITSFTADILTMLTNLVAILAIVNSNS